MGGKTPKSKAKTDASAEMDLIDNLQNLAQMIPMQFDSDSTSAKTSQKKPKKKDSTPAKTSQKKTK